MTNDDEYVELARELLDRMSDFIRASEPGEALIPLHNAYTVVKSTVDAADPDSDISRTKRLLEHARRALEDSYDRERQRREQQQADNAQKTREREKTDQGRKGWTGLDRTVKMGRILTALGDDALLRREIVKRIIETYPGISVYESDLVALLNEMLVKGELERRKEPRSPTATSTPRGATGGAGAGEFPRCRRAPGPSRAAPQGGVSGAATLPHIAVCGSSRDTV